MPHMRRWGGFKEKATSQKNMNSTLRFFIQSYNNASNDTYLFQVQKLIESQMQVCALVSKTSTQLPYCFFRHMGILTGLLG
ncbi:cystatin-like 1 [Sigmodon hispidus]